MRVARAIGTPVTGHGTPVTGRDLIGMLLDIVRPGDSVERFEGEFARYIGARFAVSTQSARSALYWVLRFMHDQSERREVVIPAYTHRSVMYAVVEAGLTPVVCDASPDSFNMDLEQLPRLLNDQTLCIIPTYMLGFPLDVEQVCKMAQANGCFVVEDATQACGAEWRGKKVGSYGDAAIFSFRKTKPITTLNGGVLVTSNDDIISRARAELLGARRPGLVEDVRRLLEISAFALAIRPRAFGFLFRLRPRDARRHYMTIGEAGGEIDVLRRMGSVQAALASVMLRNLDTRNEIRAQNGSEVSRQLSGSSDYVLPEVVGGSRSIFLRYPLLVKNSANREALAQKLLESGIWASPTDYIPVNDVPDPAMTGRIKNGSEIFRNARRTTDSILTLPTHQYLTHENITTLVRVLRNLDGG